MYDYRTKEFMAAVWAEANRAVACRDPSALEEMTSSEDAAFELGVIAGMTATCDLLDAIHEGGTDD